MSKRSDREHGSEPEDLELELPMTGPRALNPIVWKRRLATPRGRGTLLLLGSIFLLVLNGYDLTAHRSYWPLPLVVGCVGLPVSLWVIATGIAPTAVQAPWWWRLITIALAGAGLWVAIQLLHTLNP